MNINLAIRRFPTRLNDREEIDRLKVCVAQCLAVLDRFMDFIELKQCPFTVESPDKPEPQQATTTITEPQQTKPLEGNSHHSPYH